jgi:hypothetical protein
VKISDRALELRRAEYAEEYRDQVTASDMSGYWLALALDEWQASVEERLAEVRHATGFDRPPSATASTVRASFPIADPGESKYDQEKDPST